MTSEQLNDEIQIELSFIEDTIQEIVKLNRELAGTIPNIKDKTAAAAFLAQFYNGIENILKRIAKFHGAVVATGDSWHIELFKLFSESQQNQLPELFQGEFIAIFSSYRKFRHVFFHGYGFQLDWERMQFGIENIETAYNEFHNTLDRYLITLK